MTDRAESKVRQWALRKNGEPLTPKDVVELVFAFDDDAVDRHKENVDALKVTSAEAAIHEERIEVLEEWRRATSETCVARMTAIAAEMHEPIHEAHMSAFHHDAVLRSGDETGEDHRSERGDGENQSRQTWFMWSLGKNVLYLILVAAGSAITIFIDELVRHHP